MKKRQLGLPAVFSALLLATGCMPGNEMSTENARPASFDMTSLTNPGRGLGEERDPLAPIMKDVYSKSIPDDVYSDGMDGR
ncbi:hypothetical protein SAMN04487895_10397 [Paenibacillus sophorae]|uniref:Uncharacterized protein n=1 Tax=Paenibacillus sophorae TaxID=1333845 RepID=A0A1H8JNZ2_9BACL|nr:hypothetical protein [Paenibacillus sophorae]QWU13433.1 hypothetical protein KP014_15650 [Paenibacillus sophorae]SEN82379.1 hypothetical protein SAMN04487895_10397 [Paenibacillus sophorae]